MTLSKKHCVPCESGIGKLAEDKAKTMLGDLSGWRISQCGKWLRKSNKFKNFERALAFVNRVGEIAESEGHHPDIKLGWGYADVSLTTHAADGLTANDFILAAKIDEI